MTCSEVTYDNATHPVSYILGLEHMTLAEPINSQMEDFSRCDMSRFREFIRVIEKISLCLNNNRSRIANGYKNASV